MDCEVVADYQCDTGEGPLWHPGEKRVYWVDIPAGRMFRYDPATGTHEPCYDDRPIGGYTLQADGSLLLFRDRGNVVVWREGEVVRTIVEEVADLRETRFNDVCADPGGRVFCGSMRGPGGRAGRLHRLDPDGTVTVLLDGLGTPNGMGFSPDLGRMYFNDSGSDHPCTWVFDYDRASGAITNRRIFRDALANGDPGKPDGLAVDAEGYVWTGRWNGSGVMRFAPDGTPAKRIELPAQRCSSLCFAGEGLSEMYVTTAGGQDRPALGEQAGALLRVRGHGVRGMARFESRVGLE